MNKIDDKIKKLLEYDLHPTLRGGWKITEEMRALIHEIAEECNSLEVTKKQIWIYRSGSKRLLRRKSIYICSRR